MSINKTVEVKDHDAAILANRLEETGNIEGRKHLNEEDYPAIDESTANLQQDEKDGAEELGSYEGRKYKPEIDGYEQASQETDQVYSDPRDEAGLPPAGKNIGDLTVDSLSKDSLYKDNKR